MFIASSKHSCLPVLCLKFLQNFKCNKYIWVSLPFPRMSSAKPLICDRQHALQIEQHHPDMYTQPHTHMHKALKQSVNRLFHLYILCVGQIFKRLGTEAGQTLQVFVPLQGAVICYGLQAWINCKNNMSQFNAIKFMCLIYLIICHLNFNAF